MLDTVEVSKLDKLIDDKELHSLNIESKQLILEVIKLVKSMDCNELQL